MNHDLRAAGGLWPKLAPGLAAWLALAALAPLGVGAAGPARAQGQPADPSQSTTTTTAPPRSDPEVQPPPGGDSVQDSPKEPVPTEQVVIPPPPVGAAPAPEPELQQKAKDELAARQRTFNRLLSVRAGESRRFETLLGETAALEARFAIVDAERRLREDKLLEAKGRLKRLAVARYMATPVAPLNHALEAPDFMDLSRRLAVLGAVTDADRARVGEYVAASRDASGEFDRVNADLGRKRADLDAARLALEKADATLLSGKARLVSSQTGGLIVTGGLTFPVAGPHNFTDTFGAPA